MRSESYRREQVSLLTIKVRGYWSRVWLTLSECVKEIVIDWLCYVLSRLQDFLEEQRADRGFVEKSREGDAWIISS
jgi:hypothetical protein